MTDVCFLCERNPITWPGTGMCERCHQETADLEHQAERADMRRTRLSVLPMRTHPGSVAAGGAARKAVAAAGSAMAGLHLTTVRGATRTLSWEARSIVYRDQPVSTVKGLRGATGDAIQFLMVGRGAVVGPRRSGWPRSAMLRLEPPQ